MFKKIDHFELVPSDLERTIEFYTNVLDFRIKYRKKLDRSDIDEIVFLELNDTVLELVSVKDAIPQSTAPWQVGYLRIAIEVEDMEQAIEYLQSKDVTISVAPVVLGNSKRAEILDPSGLSIELRQWNVD